MMEKKYAAHRVGGVTVVNATPHEVTFLAGETGLKADASDEVVGRVGDAEIVRVAFRRSAEGDAVRT